MVQRAVINAVKINLNVPLTLVGWGATEVSMNDCHHYVLSKLFSVIFALNPIRKFLFYTFSHTMTTQKPTFYNGCTLDLNGNISLGMNA